MVSSKRSLDQRADGMFSISILGWCRIINFHVMTIITVFFYKFNFLKGYIINSSFAIVFTYFILPLSLERVRVLAHSQ